MFFDDVRVPQSNRVGPENEGWTVAKYLLEFERGGGGAAARLEVALEELKALATREFDGAEPLAREAHFSQRVSEVEIRIRALKFSELATLARMSRGESPGPASSLAKNASVEIGQQLNTLKLEAIHYYALPHAKLISLDGDPEDWVGPGYAETVTASYLNSRASSIFGGSQEVQKNIIAKMVLRL